MSQLKAELSEKNKYYINKHRGYELKHFCLQYPIWKKAYQALDGLSKRPNDLEYISSNTNISNPTERCAIAKETFSRRIEMVEEACRLTDEEFYDYILKAVTEGLSYESLLTNYKIPCCREVYYRLYRKFFWTLNKLRD